MFHLHLNVTFILDQIGYYAFCMGTLIFYWFDQISFKLRSHPHWWYFDDKGVRKEKSSVLQISGHSRIYQKIKQKQNTISWK